MMGGQKYKWQMIVPGLFILLILSSQAISNGMPESQSGNLLGVIEDAVTEERIGWTTLYIEEINRSVSAHDDGSFHFFDLPPGQYSLSTFRVGYQDASVPIKIIENDTTFLKIKLQSDPLSTEGIIVESDKYDVTSEMQKPVIEVSGKKLRQNLGMTIAKTLESEPGLDQRTMGPAPARPVIRGLSGDRLLLLEDGDRTGDLSATSADHAVVIEPMSADRIEVIRGPAALLYGANTLGGVINVNRGYVPSTLPHHITGTATFQGESVNSGYAFGSGIVVPLGSFAVRGEGSYRHAEDMHTPHETLFNTGTETKNVAGGLTYFPDWGFIGASGSYYGSKYGIPPDPSGGHPGGVTIDLERNHFETKAEIYPDFSWFYRIDLGYSRKQYEHTEYESANLVGVRFGVVTQNFNLLTHFNKKGDLAHAEIGLWGETRDYASAGLNFTPASKEYAYAGFFYGEHDLGRFGFSATMRYDHKSVVPSIEKIVNRADFDLHIRKRQFDDFSAGLTTAFNAGAGYTFGATVMRTFRAPGIEELFSEGPHLAAYSYEVGNSELGKENGLGLELYLDHETDQTDLHLAVFRNDITGYIFPRNTGRKSLRRADLYLYQYVGEDALMYGVEGTIDWKMIESVTFLGSLSYVRGELVNQNRPIPRIPPFKGRTGIRFSKGGFSLESALRFATRQNRPGEFELPTNGYVVLDLLAQYYFSSLGFLHTLSFGLENAQNSTYRQHLNRVKEIMPEPGRNLKILYRVFF